MPTSPRVCGPPHNATEQRVLTCPPRNWVPEGSMSSGSGEKSISLYSCSNQRPSWVGQNFPKAQNAEIASQVMGLVQSEEAFPHPCLSGPGIREHEQVTLLPLTVQIPSPPAPSVSSSANEFDPEVTPFQVEHSVISKHNVMFYPLFLKKILFKNYLFDECLPQLPDTHSSAQVWSSAHLTHPHTAHSSSSCSEIWCLLTLHVYFLLTRICFYTS